jgi:hypothetical protein
MRRELILFLALGLAVATLGAIAYWQETCRQNVCSPRKP